MKFDCTVNKNIYQLFFPDWEAVQNRNEVKYKIPGDNLAVSSSLMS